MELWPVFAPNGNETRPPHKNVDLSAQRDVRFALCREKSLSNVREHDSKCQSIVRRSAPSTGMCGEVRKVGEMASSAFSASQLVPRTWIIFMLHHHIWLPSTSTAYAPSVALLPLAYVPFISFYHLVIIIIVSSSTQPQSPTSAHTKLTTSISP